MYKQISIKNLKTFEDEQKLKIAPLTLIYGENSLGKTTLLKAFDIVHNIFQQRSITAGGKTAGIDSERGSSEDLKNISARKIHFFSSKINKKPIQIKLTLDLPYKNINSEHPLYSNKITEKFAYFEESIQPRKGGQLEKKDGGKIIAKRKFGRSTYYTEKMRDGSIRKMVITDTGEGEGDKKKYKISIIEVSKLIRSKNKIKMVPAKFLIEIKYFPGLKVSKINKLEIKTIDNKPIISFSRVPRQYNLPTNDRVYGYVKKLNKQRLLRSIKENPDYFTSSAGYADYKINLSKENNLWLRSYKKYEKIFITPAENGFNVAIDTENSKNMNPEEHELVSTIARGLVFQATTDPHSTFLMGVKGFKNDKEKKKEPKKRQNNVIDFIDYLKKLRDKC